MTEFIKRPFVTGSEELVDNDLLPWNVIVNGWQPCAEIGPSVGGHGAFNGYWPWNVLNYTLGNGDRITWDVYLAAGFWGIGFYTDQRGDYGLIQPIVDNVDIGVPFDNYAVGTYPNNPRAIKYASMGVTLTRGLHRIGGRVVGKNASSGGYLFTCSGLILTRYS